MDSEQELRYSKLRFKHKNKIARYQGMLRHQTNQEYRRSTIARIVGCNVQDVELLLKCIADETKYVKGAKYEDKTH